MSVDVLTFVAPNAAAIARVSQARVECWVNSPDSRFDGRTPFEIAATPQGLDRVLGLVRGQGASPDIVTWTAEALRPIPHADRLLDRAIRASGGLLNIYLPRPDPSDDELWARLHADGTQSEAESVQIWNRTPSDLFSGLTPAEVAVGGGPEEGRLLRRCLDDATRDLDTPTSGWSTEGERLRAFLIWLRRWQLTPLPGLSQRRPMELIFAERAALVAQKLGPEVARPLAMHHEARQGNQVG